jgi:hypothetical protein
MAWICHLDISICARQRLLKSSVTFLPSRRQDKSATSSTMMHDNPDVKSCGVEYPVNWHKFGRIDMECRH